MKTFKVIEQLIPNKNRVAGVLLFCFLLVVLAPGGLHGTPPIQPKRLISFWIEENGNIWYCYKGVTRSNLPKLLPPHLEQKDSARRVFDPNEIIDIISPRLLLIGRLYVSISPHPRSHFVHFENVVTVIETLEEMWTGKGLDRPKDSSDTPPKYEPEPKRKQTRLKVYCNRWQDRDNNIMVASRIGAGLEKRSERIDVEQESTFEYQLQRGRWLTRTDLFNYAGSWHPDRYIWEPDIKKQVDSIIAEIRY